MCNNKHEWNIDCDQFSEGKFNTILDVFKGTLVRIWNARSGEALAEFRRGTNPAEIFDLKFDTESKYFTVCSNTGTIHIFEVSHLTSSEYKH